MESRENLEQPMGKALSADEEAHRVLNWYGTETAEVSYVDARKFYALAAQQDSPVWKFRFGYLHYSGLGGPVDYAEALKWFSISAEQNNVDAQAWMGHLYKRGHGVDKNFAVAATWYRLATEQWHSAGFLGMSEFNRIIQKDIVQAYKWFLLHETRTRVHDEYRRLYFSELSQAQIDEANTLANTWVAEHPIRVGN